jgi:replicative DNA helicase
MQKSENYKYRPLQYATPIATDANKIKFPFSKDLEEVVLGSMLLDFEALKIALGIVKAVDFYTPIGKGVFMAIDNLIAKGGVIDVITVTEECRFLGILTDIGGAFAVTNLTKRIGSTESIDRHCYILKQFGFRRMAIQASLETLEAAQDDEQDALAVLDNLSQSVTNIYNTMPASQVTAGGIATKVLSEYKQISEGLLVRNFIKTGITAIDNVIGGAPESGLIYILAPPSAGKTTVAVQIACNIAAQDMDCSVISLETDSDTMTRMFIGNISQDLGVTPMRMFLNKIKDNGSILNMETAANDKILKKVKLHEDFNSDLKSIVGMIYADVNNGSKVIFIDYIQLIVTDFFGNEAAKLAHVCRTLQAVSRKLKVPIFVLSQLGRPEDKSVDILYRMPKISDGLNGGAIEASATIMIGLCLLKESAERMSKSEGKVHYRYMQASILKNKRGATTFGSSIPLVQVPAIYTIQSCTPEYEQDYLACCGGDTSNDLTSQLLQTYGIRNPYVTQNESNGGTQLVSIASILNDPFSNETKTDLPF